MNRVSPFPLISAFHYAGADTGGYFTKHSLSPVFFYEMEIITVGEKPSIRHCRSQSNYAIELAGSHISIRGQLLICGYLPVNSFQTVCGVQAVCGVLPNDLLR